ncbi:MAG TPA: vanadium-dependent haloperoxidase [Longimicrobium sp.]|nr:vanadium-dependent haloperoxidase [Longimicrobium sp.]
MTCVKDPYPCDVHEYALTGPQVEPEASFWNHCPHLRLISIDELTAITDAEGTCGYFPPYPDPCTPEGEARIKEEMDELLKLQDARDDPCRLENPCPDKPLLTEWPCEPVCDLPSAIGCRAEISRFFDLYPPALGAVQALRLPGQRTIRTGRGMARAVESETPGLFHRHALNYLITTRSWSPPRQALIWAALDVAIASALQAAWYYKWLSDRPLTSRRERPIEYSDRNGSGLTVLFDRPDELNPMYITCPDARLCADPPGYSPGTPRHPAYPSGHSTYAGAATTILGYFFGNDWTPGFLRQCQGSSMIGEELRNMADNIGMGRLWAGIHWRSDHEAGLKLGQVVGCLVLRQLASICDGNFVLCPPFPCMRAQCTCDDACDCPDDPPTPCKDLKEMAWKCRETCVPCAPSKHEVPPPCPPRPEAAAGAAADLRGVQQGALSNAERARLQPAQPAAGPDPASSQPQAVDARSVQQGGR